MKNKEIEFHRQSEVFVKKTLKNAVQRWHRNIGIIVALFILVFALSGISLNHTESLKLDEIYIDSPLILDLYGIKTPEEIWAFTAAGQWISQIGQRTFFNDKELKTDAELLVGVVQINDFIVAAFANQILLLTHQGELIDQLTETAGLPEKLTAVAVYRNKVWIKSAEQVFSSDADLLDWEIQKNDLNLPWGKHEAISPEIKHKLIKLYRGNGLSYERILLDVHSGRIFGQWIVLLLDFIAVLLIVMSMSGIWLWVKGNKRNKVA